MLSKPLTRRGEKYKAAAGRKGDERNLSFHVGSAGRDKTGNAKEVGINSSTITSSPMPPPGKRKRGEHEKDGEKHGKAPFARFLAKRKEGEPN